MRSEPAEAIRRGVAFVTEPVHLTCDALRGLIGEIFARAGVPADEGDIVADVLLEATMAGYLSHGIMRVPLYVEAIRRGRIHPGVRTRVLRRSASALHLDAGHGLGPVSATEAVGHATGMAAQSGVGCVSVVRAADVARLGSYVIEPARSGFVCLLLVNDAGGNPNVAPWGSTEPFLSTNPLAAGIPRRGAAPIVIDMSTSVAAAGRLKMLAAEGREAPEGWLIDETGQPCTDPAAALDLPPRAALLPLGGLLAGHKGFALSLLVDVLAGALSGAGCSAGDLDSSDRNGLFVLAVDPEHFLGREGFLDQVEEYVRRLKGLRTAPGVEEVLVPGERAHRERERAMAEGLWLDPGIWAPVRALMDELGLAEE